MVRSGLLLLLAIYSAAASAVTGDELRRLFGAAAEQRRAQGSRFDPSVPGALNELKASPAEPADAAPPPSRADSSPAPGRPPRASRPSARAVPSGLYIPPPRRTATEGPGYSYRLDGPKEFGIRVGSWLNARLVRDTDSAEPGRAVLRLTESVPGRRRELPAGSELFATKRYNEATGRLDLTVVGGVTPEGEEFEVSGLVFDDTRRSGLAGTTRERRLAEGAAKQGLVAGVGAALSTFSSGPAGEALRTGAGALLQEGRRSARSDLAVRTLIRVRAQPVQIRVESSF